jgi:hypothetical protein
MKQFCILNENEYKDFQEKSAQRSFMNSIEAINLKKTNGWDVEYAGVKEDGRLIAATPLTYIPVMKIYRFCHAQGGLLADYRDMETLTFFTEELIGISGDRQVEISDRASLMNVLLATDCYTIGTGIMPSLLNEGRIVSIPLSSDDYYSIGYLTRGDKTLSPLAKEFIDRLHKTVAQLQ